ncbi:MAG: gliding motility protein [Flavobacterium sp.]|nr:gliding motility protein [Flavobacterium sp.]
MLIYNWITFFLIACSVKKDRFVNRNFHAVTTEYNILYNGNLALDAGLEEVVLTYQDNFWEILPVERLPDNEEKMLPGQTKNPNFERAEEKAKKAIVKHSMNIKGKEHNPQMDEAHLLLAKARYYDYRFLPALEALNYILYKYPKSNKIYHAKVWREKVNIRLDNNETAIKNLKELLEDEKIEGQDLADANAMLTEAYMNIKANDSAIATIKIAKEETNNKEEKARYAFILGQLYESLEYNDSAYVTFQEVIDMKRKAPRRYVIQAHAKQALQFDHKKGDTLVFTEKFNKLLEDRENRPYLDILYHQMGVFYDKQEIDSTAKKFYNKSIKTGSQDKYLVASNYRNLGEMYFKDTEYKVAGQYYDSTLLAMNDRTREYRKIKKKRDNLEDVIKYEAIAKENDSILTVVAMSEAERNSYYEKIIEKLKEQDEIKAKKEAELAKIEANKEANKAIAEATISNNSNLLPLGGFPVIDNDQGKSTFYFYNPVTVAFGKKEFKSKWGSRELKENWRVSATNTINNATVSDDDVDENDVVFQNDSLNASTSKPEYEVSFYTSKLPTSQVVIDSLAKDRNFAYYQLGSIYKEKFKEYQLAANRLEQLLKNNPEERLILPAKYNLYKIYEIINLAKAEEYKKQIIEGYPESRYAQILSNPSLNVEDDMNPEAVYKRLYKKYEQNQLREAYQEVEERIEQYFGEESLPKFEMLKANIIARLQGLEAYKKVLNFVSLTYSNVEEGKQAEQLLQKDIPTLEIVDFQMNEATSWKIIFPKNYLIDVESSKKLTETIEKYLKTRSNPDLKLSVDIYDMDTNFIVIHGFITEEVAKATLSVLQEYKDYKIKDKSHIVSSEDYKIIQIKKKFLEWIK